MSRGIFDLIAKKDWIACMDELPEASQEEICFEAQDWGRSTPLHIACSLSAPSEVIALLIRKGAHVNALDNTHRTALHYLCSVAQTSTRSLTALLNGGVNVNGEATGMWTPLHYACGKHGSAVVVRLLIEHGAYVNGVNQSGESPLHIACKQRAPIEVIDALLKRGADLDMRDIEGRTPLDLEKRPEVKELLGNPLKWMPFYEELFREARITGEKKQKKHASILFENGISSMDRVIRLGHDGLVALGVSGKDAEAMTDAMQRKRFAVRSLLPTAVAVVVESDEVIPPPTRPPKPFKKPDDTSVTGSSPLNTILVTSIVDEEPTSAPIRPPKPARSEEDDLQHSPAAVPEQPPPMIIATQAHINQPVATSSNDDNTAGIPPVEVMTIHREGSDTSTTAPASPNNPPPPPALEGSAPSFDASMDRDHAVVVVEALPYFDHALDPQKITIFISHEWGSRATALFARDCLLRLSSRINCIVDEGHFDECYSEWRNSAINESHAVIMLISSEYSFSTVCEGEAKLANLLQKSIFPVFIDPSVEGQTGDDCWLQEAIEGCTRYNGLTDENLMDSLRRIVKDDLLKRQQQPKRDGIVLDCCSCLGCPSFKCVALGSACAGCFCCIVLFNEMCAESGDCLEACYEGGACCDA